MVKQPNAFDLKDIDFSYMIAAPSSKIGTVQRMDKDLLHHGQVVLEIDSTSWNLIDINNIGVNGQILCYLFSKSLTIDDLIDNISQE